VASESAAETRALLTQIAKDTDGGLPPGFRERRETTVANVAREWMTEQSEPPFMTDLSE